MKIAVTGASGFIATSIQKQLAKSCEAFLILKRDEPTPIWEEKIEQADVIINLAGYSIAKRWTKANKRKILSSRIQTTRRIVDILNRFPEQKSSKVFISASATGIYPNSNTELFNESSQQLGQSFLSEVVVEWEAEAKQLSNPNVRLVITRFGVVLGKGSPMIKQLRPIFSLGLGGRIGNGLQIMPFIHIDDLISAIRFFIEKEELSGIFNLVSPVSSTNKKFTLAFAKTLKIPAFFVVPSFVLRLFMGEASQIITKGTNVFPLRLLSSGFEFKYQTIDDVLAEICK